MILIIQLSSSSSSSLIIFSISRYFFCFSLSKGSEKQWKGYKNLSPQCGVKNVVFKSFSSSPQINSFQFAELLRSKRKWLFADLSCNCNCNFIRFPKRFHINSLDYASGPTSSPIMSLEQVNNLMEVCFSLVYWFIVHHISIFVCF